MSLGKALVSAAEVWAAREGIRSLYLLTNTAADLFTRLGYEAIPREEAPLEITATSQFSKLCPASPTFLRKMLET